jgi:hypothetical protein
MVGGLAVGQQTVLASMPHKEHHADGELVDDVSLESAKRTLDDVKHAHSTAKLALETAHQRKEDLDRHLQARQLQKVQKALQKAKLKQQTAAVKEVRVQGRLQQLATLELEKTRIQAECKACAISTSAANRSPVCAAPQAPGDASVDGRCDVLMLDTTIYTSHDDDEVENDEASHGMGNDGGAGTSTASSTVHCQKLLVPPPIPPPLSAQKIIDLFNMRSKAKAKATAGQRSGKFDLGRAPPVPPPFVLPSMAPPLPPPIPVPLPPNQTGRTVSSTGHIAAAPHPKLAAETPPSATTDTSRTLKGPTPRSRLSKAGSGSVGYQKVRKPNLVFM